MSKEVRQGLTRLEGDEVQQHVAGEGQIERGLGFSMTMPVLLPGAGVAFVMVAVFTGGVHAPPHGTGFCFHLKAREEKAGAAFLR